MFTRQTVLLINIYFIILFFFTNLKINKYLSFICLFNCLLLCIYNFKIENKELYNQRKLWEIWIAHLEHIIVPLIFYYYYFFIDKTTLKLKNFYIVLIHPFIYLITCFFLKNTPYKSLNLKRNLNNLFFYSIFVLLISGMSLILILLKRKILKKYYNLNLKELKIN